MEAGRLCSRQMYVLVVYGIEVKEWVLGSLAGQRGRRAVLHEKRSGNDARLTCSSISSNLSRMFLAMAMVVVSRW
jgi:hypothetical protein